MTPVMASAEILRNMSKTLPPGYEELATVVKRGPNQTVGVIGVVADFMTPSKTRGTQYQMTMTIRDLSELLDGLRIKFFKACIDDFPRVVAKGDVIAIQHLKITEYKGNIVGISNYATRFFVVPDHSIPLPGTQTGLYDTRQIQTVYPSHPKHSPSLHEQKWIFNLKDNFSIDVEMPAQVNALPRATVIAPLKRTQESTATPKESGSPEPTPKKAEISKPIKSLPLSLRCPKFSLIENIDGGQKWNSIGSGKFFDLATEIVKMHMRPTGKGIMDLYVTDYTWTTRIPANDWRDYDPRNDTQRNKSVPGGRYILRVELMPPHSMWTQENMREGDFAWLKNVRIKWTDGGGGYKVEANIWPDHVYTNKINVARLTDHEIKLDLLRRKAAFERETMREGLQSTTKKGKKAKRKQRKNSNAAGRQDYDSDSETTFKRSKRQKTADSDISNTGDARNPNVRCDYREKPYSSIFKILKNPTLADLTKKGKTVEYPFTNVKHHAKLTVRDYYPHKLEAFSVEVEDPNTSDPPHWEWRFWLVLEKSGGDAAHSPTLTVEVFRDDAENFLQMKACDLRKPDNMKQFKQTLGLVCGLLIKGKEKFLAAHPHIKADSAFTSREYELNSTGHMPFELCIAEYGKRVPVEKSEGDAGHEKGKEQWQRTFKLFGTQILTDQAEK